MAPVERRADADVGDRGVAGGLPPGLGHVHAVRRQRLVVRYQVGGGEADRPSAAFAAAHLAAELERPTEESPGPLYVAGLDRGAHRGRRDRLVPEPDRRDAADVEPVLAADSLEQGQVATPPAPEAEVLTDVNGGEAQPAIEDRGEELLAGQHRQALVEAQDQHGVEAPTLEGVDLLPPGHDETGGAVGCHDVQRMGLEGDQQRGRATPPRVAEHAVQDLPVAEVHAVVVADRRHDGAIVVGPVFDAVPDFHRSFRQAGMSRSAICSATLA